MSCPAKKEITMRRVPSRGEGDWDTDGRRMGLTEEGRCDRRAIVAAKAARLAADPVAGPYMFGSLAAMLDDSHHLIDLASAVATAEKYAAQLRDEEPPAEPGPDADAAPAPGGIEAA
jgi:hypothetical protein